MEGVFISMLMVACAMLVVSQEEKKMDDFKVYMDVCMNYFHKELKKIGISEEEVVAFEIEDDCGIFYTTSGKKVRVGKPEIILHEGVDTIQ